MPKLTLSVDAAVVSRAKRYAKGRSTSLSQMVEAYLDSLTQSAADPGTPPILGSVRGILKHADVESYRRHLARKHR